MIICTLLFQYPDVTWIKFFKKHKVFCCCWECKTFMTIFNFICNILLTGKFSVASFKSSKCLFKKVLLKSQLSFLLLLWILNLTYDCQNQFSQLGIFIFYIENFSELAWSHITNVNVCFDLLITRLIS